MSILAANLKHFYQNRLLWFFYLWICLLSLQYIVGMVFAFHDYGYMLALFPLMISYFIGINIVSTQTEILSKPFTYCLPGHKKNVRKVLLIIGVITSLLYSLPLLWCLNIDLLKLYGIFICIFFAYLTFYWLGIIFELFLSKGSPLKSILYLILIVILLYVLYLIREFVIQYLFILIISGMYFSFLAWKLLGNENIMRQFCGKPIISISDMWDIAKTQKKRWGLISEKRFNEYGTNPKIDQYFLSQIHKSQSFNTESYIWGSLYERFGIYTKTFIKLMPSLMLLMVLLGYLSFSSGIFLIGILTLYNQIPIFSNWLIAGGRHERFITTIIIVAIHMIVITICCTIIAVFSILIKDMMPEFSLFGETFSFHEADVRLFFVPPLTIPISSVFNFVFYRKQILVMILNMVLCYSMIAIAIAISSNQNEWHGDRFELILPKPEIIIITIFLSWSLFLIVLKYICEKKSLVK